MREIEIDVGFHEEKLYLKKFPGLQIMLIGSEAVYRTLKPSQSPEIILC